MSNRTHHYLVTITHTCGHQGQATSEAWNPNTSKPVQRARRRKCYDCRVADGTIIERSRASENE